MTNLPTGEYSNDLDSTSIDTDNPERVTRYALVPATVAVILENGQVVRSKIRHPQAMIDTGASVSAVSKTLARDLGLTKVGTETGLGMESFLTERILYRTHLELPNLGVAWDTVLFETDAGQGLFDIIIGNDLLANLTFSVDGPTGKFTLRYPAFSGRPDAESA